MIQTNADTDLFYRRFKLRGLFHPGEVSVSVNMLCPLSVTSCDACWDYLHSEWDLPHRNQDSESQFKPAKVYEPELGDVSGQIRTDCSLILSLSLAVAAAPVDLNSRTIKKQSKQPPQIQTDINTNMQLSQAAERSEIQTNRLLRGLSFI